MNPATVRSSQPTTKYSNEKQNATKDDPNASFVVVIMPNLYFFMMSPPKKMPRHVAGKIAMPEIKDSEESWVTSTSQQI